MVALYRPGPMEHIPTFIKAKHGIESTRYPHPAVKEILEETYGVIVYQDQVLHIVRALAGYSLGQADIFRKAMGKKIPEVMKKEKQNFINGAQKNGVSTELAAEIFALIEPFAGYAFNKAHSVSYALIAYQTAYLKANYTLEYMAAFLNTYAFHPDRLPPAIAESRRLNIPVLPPDINKSQTSFAIEKEDGKAAIRFSLTAIKNVGYAAIEPIILARKNGGEFKSIEDFCRRVDLRNINKKVIESLIKAGAFDKLASRGALLQAMDRIISLAQWEQRLRESGQTSMFDLWGDSVPTPLPNLNLDDLDTPLKDRLEWERELLGVYVSEHPLSTMAPSLANAATALCGGIDIEMAGEKVIIAGMVTSIRQLYTRDKRPFVIATLEDLDGSIEVAAWSEVYGQTKEMWQEGKILLVEGMVKARDDRPSINCFKVRQYQTDGETSKEKEKETEPAPAPPPVPRKIVINITQSERSDDDVIRLKEVMEALDRYPGQDTVLISVVTPDESVNMKMPKTINYCPDLAKEIDGILGENNLKWYLK
jgi:DNA polymerase-3 subunit alpha